MTEYRIPRRILKLQSLTSDRSVRLSLGGISIKKGYATATNLHAGLFSKLDNPLPEGVWKFPCPEKQPHKEKHDLDCECECNYDPSENLDTTFKHDKDILIDCEGKAGGNGILIKNASFPDFSKALPDKVDDSYHVIVLDVGLLKTLADCLNSDFGKLEIAIPENPEDAIICRSLNSPSIGILMPCRAEEDEDKIINGMNEAIANYRKETSENNQ